MSDVDKLQHLLNAVEGPVAQRLKGVPLIALNFAVVWERLIRRYDNSQLQLSSLLESLIQFPQVRARNPNDLSDLAYKVKFTVDWRVQSLRPALSPPEVR